MFSRPLSGSEIVLGYLGVNRILVEPDGAHEVDVYVGVHHPEVEALYERSFGPTVAEPLRELMPDEERPDKDGWMFAPGAGNVDR